MKMLKQMKSRRPGAIDPGVMPSLREGLPAVAATSSYQERPAESPPANHQSHPGPIPGVGEGRWGLWALLGVLRRRRPGGRIPEEVQSCHPWSPGGYHGHRIDRAGGWLREGTRRATTGIGGANRPSRVDGKPAPGNGSPYIAIVRAENETDLSFKVGGILDLIGPGPGHDWEEGTMVNAGTTWRV